LGGLEDGFRDGSAAILDVSQAAPIEETPMIREVDGGHSMGAAQLAEALMARGVTGPTPAVR
jgi:hypothetical protein